MVGNVISREKLAIYTQMEVLQIFTSPINRKKDLLKIDNRPLLKGDRHPLRSTIAHRSPSDI